MALLIACDKNVTPFVPPLFQSATQAGPTAPSPLVVRLTGRVTSEHGIPVPGATVTTYDGALGSTVTDENGFYDLTLAYPPRILRHLGLPTELPEPRPARPPPTGLHVPDLQWEDEVAAFDSKF